MKMLGLIRNCINRLGYFFERKNTRYGLWTLMFIWCIQSSVASAKNNSKAIDSLKNVVVTASSDSAVAKSMKMIAMLYRRVNSDSTLTWAEKLIDFGKKKNMPQSVIVGYIIKGNVYRFDNDIEKSIQAYKMSLRESQLAKDNEAIAQSYGCLMKMEIVRAGPADSIRNYFDKIMELKDSIVSDQRIIPDTYSDFAEFLLNRGDYRIALYYLQQGIRMYEASQDEKRIVFAKTQLGWIHSRLNNQAKADQIFQEIAPKALELKSYTIYANILSLMGESYLEKKEFGKADEYLHKALAANEKYNSQENSDHMLTLLAALKIELHQTDSAIYFANKALQVVQAPSAGHMSYLQLSKAFTQKGDFITAEKYALNFLKEQKKQEMKVEIANAYEVLFNLYEKWGNYKEALHYHHLFEKVKKDLYSEENSNRMADMEAWYWGTQKRNELKLAKKNEELKTKEIKEALIEKQLYASQRNGLIIGLILLVVFGIFAYKLTIQAKKNKLMQQVTALELKAIRAQMNPHFLFNALSAIQMLINKSDLRQANIGLAKFGRLMRMILENSEKQTITIEEEVKTLELYVELEVLRFPFNYKFSIDSTLDKENMEIPSMVIQPYLENAIKHGISGKQEGREIAVNFKQEGKQLFCTIEDNGIGRAMAEATKSKYAQHKSMGSKLSADRLALLSKQISGKAEVVIRDLYSEDGFATGTLVELNIPITYYEN